MQYVTTAGDEEGCIFCNRVTTDDAEGGVLYRGEHAFVLLNAFPYNTGHVMIAPLRHVADLTELSTEEATELWGLVTRSEEVIREAMSPHGFNVGANIGAAAGAGVPGHVHVHVVPRWSGDTNFMTTVGDTKVLPEMLAETATKLRPGFS